MTTSSSNAQTPPTNDQRRILDFVRDQAQRSELFGEISFIDGPTLSLEAPDAAAPAFYRVGYEQGKLFVSLVTPDRYLSQSVEQDLVHTGDKLSDLLHDELIDVDHPAPYTPTVEHFRDREKLFTFRTPVHAAELSLAGDEPARRVWLLLKAYQACFVNLGDIDAGEEDVAPNPDLIDENRAEN